MDKLDLLCHLIKAKVIDMKSRRILADRPSSSTPKISDHGHFPSASEDPEEPMSPARMAGKTIHPGSDEHWANIKDQENPQPNKFARHKIAKEEEVLKFNERGQWSLDKTFTIPGKRTKWTDLDAQEARELETHDVAKQPEHTNTGQRGVKAYTTSVHGTAKEQAARAPAGAAGPVKRFTAPKLPKP